MKIATVIISITYICILVVAFYLLVFNYICDNETCKPFKDAETQGEKGSDTYLSGLLNSIGADGLWPFAYIAATLLSGLGLWMMRVCPISIKCYSILFLISFIVIYLMLAFIFHHYIQPITDYLNDNITFSDEIKP